MLSPGISLAAISTSLLVSPVVELAAVEAAVLPKSPAMIDYVYVSNVVVVVGRSCGLLQ